MTSTNSNKLAANGLTKLYLHSGSADVHFEFTTDGENIKVPAHKAILAIVNPKFEAMFFGPNKIGDTVKVADSNADSFEEFLQFFYLPEVTLTMENIKAVARFAKEYDMLDCLNAYITFLQNHLTLHNIFEIFTNDGLKIDYAKSSSQAYILDEHRTGYKKYQPTDFESGTSTNIVRMKREAFGNSNKVILNCRLNTMPQSQTLTQRQESTYFSVTAPVQLKCIHFNDVIISTPLDATKCLLVHRPAYLTPTMSIIEYDRLSFAASDVAKQLYSGEVELPWRFVDLQYGFKPITILPDRMYEIRFKLALTPPPDEYRHTSYEKRGFKSSRVTIKFHENPAEKESERRGLVSRLEFELLND